MLNIFARASISKLIAPLGARLAAAGVTADAVTVVGTTGAVGAALGFFSQGYFFVGTLVIWFFVMLDMVDGAVARAGGVSSKFGALLDSTLDRVADGAVFGALAWYFADGHSKPLLLASLLCLVFGAVTSYIKARAEGLGMTANVGIAERAERLIIVLVGTGLDGLGVPYVQAIALWVLVAATGITVVQRMVEVRRQSNELQAPRSDSGAEQGSQRSDSGAEQGSQRSDSGAEQGSQRSDSGAEQGSQPAGAQ